MFLTLTPRSSRRLSALLVAAVCVFASALATPVYAEVTGSPGLAAPVSAQDAPGGAAVPGDGVAAAGGIGGASAEQPPELANDPSGQQADGSVPMLDGASAEQPPAAGARPEGAGGEQSAAAPSAGDEATAERPAAVPSLAEQGATEDGSSSLRMAVDVDPAEPVEDVPVSLRNINLSIRILSPGDDGGVSQGIVVPGLPEGVGALIPVEDGGGDWSWTWNWNWTWDQACGAADAPAATAAGSGGWSWNWNWNWICGPEPKADDGTTPDAPGSHRPVSAPQPATPQPTLTELAPSHELQPPTSPKDAGSVRRSDAPAATTSSPPLAAVAPAAMRQGPSQRMAGPVDTPPAAPRTARASAGAPPGQDSTGGPPDHRRRLLDSASVAVASGGGGGSVLLAALLGALVLLVPGRGRRAPARDGRLRLLSRSSRLERPG